MPIQFDTAKLTVQLNSKEHNLGEIWSVIETLDNLSMTGFWASLLAHEQHDENIHRARQILRNSLERNRNSSSRFYPDFYRLFDREGQLDYFFENFNSGNILDTSVLIGMNSWIRKEILIEDNKLFNQLFGQAVVSRLEHHSPLVIELALGIAIPLLPVIMTYGIMRAVASFRKMEIENQIRDNERKIKDEEYEQKKIQTKTLVSR